jgi:hypothetical protein
MKYYSYLGHVEPPRYWKKLAYNLAGKSNDCSWLGNKSLGEDEIFFDSLDNSDETVGIVAASTARWHTDYTSPFSTMCILRSDLHIIQDHCYSNADNNRVLKAGDIFRLNTRETHRLISKKTNPMPFVAVCYESNSKVSARCAITYFNYLFRRHV